jgi:hypothetical protein
VRLGRFCTKERVDAVGVKAGGLDVDRGGRDPQRAGPHPGVLLIHIKPLTHVDARLVAAKARLDRLAWWPRPVKVDRVRLWTVPWAFRLPGLRRFDGFALYGVILLRSPQASDDLVTHELCHVWQLQHRPVRVPLSYLRTGYATNGYERQARAAVAATPAVQTST